MRLMVIGSGGREHAICWKLLQNKSVEQIYCAPGNGGTASIVKNVPISVEQVEHLVKFAIMNNIDFTIVGTEVPLCLGIVDAFRNKGLRIFGPDKNSSKLEGSKCFAKSFMKKYSIPTADSEEFTDRKEAIKFLEKLFKSDDKAVIKADGLASGKGVLIADSFDTAKKAVNICFDGEFGAAGKKILIEEFLDGEEASILAFTDGISILPLISSQDHKRIGDYDTGLNTGGMGAYCPAPIVTPELMNLIERDILSNFLNGIQSENMDYRGIIYAGVMISPKGVNVLEFNVRLGDPETQAVISLLESDLLDLMLKTEEKKLSECSLKWKEGSAVCVVISAEGYPGEFKKGDVINGLKEAGKIGANVFHAGTRFDGEKFYTSGGRVLGVTAVEKTLDEAIEKAYRGVKNISWNGAYYRTDIGQKAKKFNK